MTSLGFSTPSELRNAVTDASRVEGVEEVLFISSDILEVVAFMGSAAVNPAFDPTAEDPLEIFLPDTGVDPILLNAEQEIQDIFPLVRGSRPASPSSAEFDTFAFSYEFEFKEDPRDAGFSAHMYDAAMMSAYGAAWAHYQEDGITGLNIAKGFRKLSNPDTVEFPIRATQYVAGASRFREGTPINLVGASGSLDFDPVTGETSTPIEVWVIVEDASDSDFGYEVVLTCEPDGECS